MAFVGTLSLKSTEELKQFLAEIKQEQDYYFWRSPHKVSGIQSELPEEINSATEGQVFNFQWELRWKKKGSKYELLLLSTFEPDSHWKFEPLTIKRINKQSEQIKEVIKWKTEDRKALLYEANEIKDKQIRSKETRFPKGFTHNKPKIGQRYFLDSQTATVHFIALTVQTK